VVVADRRYRLVGLPMGEVALHDDQGLRVHLTRNGLVFDGAGMPVNFVNTPVLQTDGNFVAAGSIAHG